MNHEKFQSGLDLAYLAACALRGETPSENVVTQMNIKYVYKHACRHSMQGITYLALRAYVSAGGSVDTDVLSALERDYSASVYKIVGFQPERDKIYSFFEQNGIWYLPLKGIILQNYYPDIGMRQMVDNDIYFNLRFRKTLKKFMSKQGYQVYSYGKGAHDIYIKRPFTFELHAYLYTESVSEIFFNYYNTFFSRFLKDDENSFGYHLSTEDFYIHLVTHSYKHYTHGGVGLRSLMDVYVYLSANPGIDFEYITSELETLGISEFESLSRRLAFLLFGKTSRHLPSSLSDEDLQSLSAFVNSATYGVTSTAVKQGVSRYGTGFGAKLRYSVSVLFPNMLFYKYNYPFLYKYKLFIPTFVVARWVYKLFFSPVKTFKHIKNIFFK